MPKPKETDTQFMNQPETIENENIFFEDINEYDRYTDRII